VLEDAIGPFDLAKLSGEGEWRLFPVGQNVID
jgi:hypothetical protein